MSQSLANIVVHFRHSRAVNVLAGLKARHVKARAEGPGSPIPQIIRAL